jgi:pre-mRNA-splicing factor SPF27
MARSDKKLQDYLDELPAPPAGRLGGHPLLQTEAERVARGEAMAPLDVARYAMQPPPVNKRNDWAAWRGALDNAEAQLEHQQLRLCNLELMAKFGPNVWRAHNMQLDVLIKQFGEELAAVRAETDQVNKERKLQQLQASEEMARVEREWYELIQKNLEIEAACRAEEKRVEGLRERVDAAREAKLAGAATNGGAAAGPAP